jgi:hypothetical protein
MKIFNIHEHEGMQNHSNIAEKFLLPARTLRAVILNMETVEFIFEFGRYAIPSKDTKTLYRDVMYFLESDDGIITIKDGKTDY